MIVTWLSRMLGIGGRGKMVMTTLCAAYLVATIMLATVAPIAAYVAAAIYYTVIVATLADAQFNSAKSAILDGSRESD